MTSYPSPVTIRFPKRVSLVLEQKTDSNDEMSFAFMAGDTVTLPCIQPDPENDGLVTLHFARETGWVARGVITSCFEVVG